MRTKIILISSILTLVVLSCSDEKEYVEYHPNGQLAWKGRHIGGKKEGQWVQFDSLGNKLAIFDYKKDTLRLRRFFSDNKLTSKEEMLGENIKHGVTLTYHNNGALDGKMNFSYNQQVGEQTFYHPNGKLASTYLQTENGVSDLFQYYENGNLFVYAKDMENGEVNFHDSLGNRAYDLLYENSIIVDTLKSYFDDI